MPSPRKWTEQEINTISQMRAKGANFNEIAKAVGLSRNAVSAKCYAIGAKVMVDNRKSVDKLEGRRADPLPAGSKETWGAISKGYAWPYGTVA